MPRVPVMRVVRSPKSLTYVWTYSFSAPRAFCRCGPPSPSQAKAALLPAGTFEVPLPDLSLPLRSLMKLTKGLTRACPLPGPSKRGKYRVPEKAHPSGVSDAGECVNRKGLDCRPILPEEAHL